MATGLATYTDYVNETTDARDLASSTGAPPRIDWLGHATTSIRVDGVHLLTDPLLRPALGPIRRRRGAVEVAALGRPDAVLISHLHHDHLDLPSLRLLGTDVPVIVPEGAGRLLFDAGFREVDELPIGRSTLVGAVRVTAVPAAHPGGRLLSTARGHASGYLVEGSRSVYFAGDTERFEEMRDLHGGVDMALLPVGGWGLTRGAGHMDWQDAAAALADIAPRQAVPIHWGTFWPAGLSWARRELFALPGPRFQAAAHVAAPAVAVSVLAPGEALPLAGAGRPLAAGVT
jgi:L-ascorbate metabolism protein UlaG (beta-lactamase superfamily)